MFVDINDCFHCFPSQSDPVLGPEDRSAHCLEGQIGEKSAKPAVNWAWPKIAHVGWILGCCSPVSLGQQPNKCLFIINIDSTKRLFYKAIIPGAKQLNDVTCCCFRILFYGSPIMSREQSGWSTLFSSVQVSRWTLHSYSCREGVG